MKTYSRVIVNEMKVGHYFCLDSKPEMIPVQKAFCVLSPTICYYDVAGL